jgi:sRNA-binding protein
MIAFWIVLLIVLMVGGWWWRYRQVKDMADRFGLDAGSLMAKDLFGADGAVERELAEVALNRSEEANRRLDRERSARQKSDQQRDAAERARLVAAASEVKIVPAVRPREVRLQELTDMASKGVITAEEAATRRAEILKEI